MVLMLATLTGVAQDVTIGRVSDGYEDLYSPSNGTLSVLDLNERANAAGSLTTATLRMETTTTCDGTTFVLRFFRARLSAMELVAERGPFNAVKGWQTVELSPAVPVRADDLVGIAITGSNCGIISTLDSTQAILTIPGNYAGGGPIPAPQFQPGQRLALRVSNAPLALVGYVPGVGVVAGSAGSSFDTTFTIANPSSRAVDLAFVYRAAGRPGRATDPRVTLALGPRQTASPDLLEQFGVTSGLGSVDVYSSGAAPVINARVFNTPASGGTNGFSEVLVPPAGAANSADFVSLAVPIDLNAFRLNLGLRSLASGAMISCTSADANGATTASFVRQMQPNTFELNAASVFFSGGGTVAAGGHILCSVENGSAIIFGTVTDNATNDSALVEAVRF
jgi:hypothetical protein